jgi:hypothetical protein
MFTDLLPLVNFDMNVVIDLMFVVGSGPAIVEIQGGDAPHGRPGAARPVPVEGFRDGTGSCFHVRPA